MANLPFRKKFELMIVEAYGLPEGIRASQVLVPSILGDFRKMLEKAGPGVPVREEYKTEDGRTTIEIEGEMVRNGKKAEPCVRGLRVGGREMTFELRIAGKPGAWI